MKLPSPPRAVVFDFDGVIIESVELKSRAFTALFPDRPDLHDSIRAHHEERLGISRQEKIRWILESLLGREPDPGTVDELASRYSHLVLEEAVRCPEVPGARSALEALGRLGVPAFVASGTPEAELRDIVARRGLAHLFDGILGSPATKPAILRRILEERELAPEAVVMIGDGASDWEAAVAAGVPFVLRRTVAQPTLDGADLIRVPDLRALAEEWDRLATVKDIGG